MKHKFSEIWSVLCLPKTADSLNKNSKGFSLIGIIISMVAIGVLTISAIPTLKGILFENQANRVSVLANTLINAESTYVNNKNQFKGISGLQAAGYLAQGLGMDFVDNNPRTDCIYGTITAKNDTKICLGVNNANQSGTSREISYTLTITPDLPAPPFNYYNYYSEIRHNIPGSSIINKSEIEYIDPIDLGNAQGLYSRYVGKSFYITGAVCYITEHVYMNTGRGHHHERTYNGGGLLLYFIVEAIEGGKAILSYANNPYSKCTMAKSYTNNAGDTYSYSSWVGGAFQNTYLPQIWGTVRYLNWQGGMSYVPVESPGYEIEIPTGYLPHLINLNQLNTVN